MPVLGPCPSCWSVPRSWSLVRCHAWTRNQGPRTDEEPGTKDQGRQRYIEIETAVGTKDEGGQRYIEIKSALAEQILNKIPELYRGVLIAFDVRDQLTFAIDEHRVQRMIQ
jgi:hypothetical protein